MTHLVRSTGLLSQEQALDFVPLSSLRGLEIAAVRLAEGKRWSISESTDPEISAMVEIAHEVFQQLRQSINQGDCERSWKLYVVDGDQVQATSLGSSVFLDIAFLNILRDGLHAQQQAQAKKSSSRSSSFRASASKPGLTHQQKTALRNTLAFVFGHEIAHSLESHHGQRLSISIVLFAAFAASLAGAVFVLHMPLSIGVVAMTALLAVGYGQLESFSSWVGFSGLLAAGCMLCGASIPFSPLLAAWLVLGLRKICLLLVASVVHRQEFAADRYGLALAKAANFNASEGAATFFQSLQVFDDREWQQHRPKLHSEDSLTHPSIALRLAHLADVLKNSGQPPLPVFQRPMLLVRSVPN